MRIRNPAFGWIRGSGSGSTPKCHGSTLVECFATFATFNVVLCFRTLAAALPADPRAQYAAQRVVQHKRVSRAPLTLQPSPRGPTVTPLPPLTCQLYIRTYWWVSARIADPYESALFLEAGSWSGSPWEWKARSGSAKFWSFTGSK